MSGRKEPRADQSLHAEYERVKDAGESRGKGAEQAKRDAARAVHDRRRKERMPDKEQPPG